MDTAGVVDQIERGLDAELHLVPELLGRAGERCRDSKPNLIIGHPAEGRGALTCIANRRGACRILADGSRVRRRTRGASGGGNWAVRGVFRLARRGWRNTRLISTRATALV